MLLRLGPRGSGSAAGAGPVLAVDDIYRVWYSVLMVLNELVSRCLPLVSDLYARRSR